MKKIVTLTGKIDSKKDWVARKLAENSDVEFVFPYVGINLPSHAEATELVEYHVVLPDVLTDMTRKHEVLYSIGINDKMYVFFDFQMKAPFNVVVVDDQGVIEMRKNWKGEMYTILVESQNQKEGGRAGKDLKPSDFDEVFNADTGDLDELEARIYG